MNAATSNQKQDTAEWWANAIQLACDNVGPRYALSRAELIELVKEVELTPVAHRARELDKQSVPERRWWQFWRR